MFDIIGGLAGVVMNLVVGIIEIIITIICDLIICSLSGLAAIFLQAMAVTPDQVEGWLGDALTTGSFGTMITSVGFAIAMLFAMWELVKGLFAHISGENLAVRPYVVGIRAFMFGAWTICGISFSKLIFNVGSTIYNSVDLGAYSMTADGAAISIATHLVTGVGSIFGGMAGSGEYTSVWASALAKIAVCIILVATLANFLKLLLICAQRFVSIVFYTYLSPLAIGCGVSPTWSRITWSWFKTFLSTLILWVLDIWCVFGSIQLLNAAANEATGTGLGSITGAISCVFVTYGFVNVSKSLDGIMSQLGASVTKTSGSLMGDVRDMMIAGRAATGIIRGGIGAAKATGRAVTGAAGLAGRAAANTGALVGQVKDAVQSGGWRSGAGVLGGAVGGAIMGSGIGQAIRSIASNSPVTTFKNAMSNQKASIAAAQTSAQNVKDAKAMTGLSASENREIAAAQDRARSANGGKLPSMASQAGQALQAEEKAIRDKYADQRAGIMRDASARGVTQNDMLNDSSVKQAMAENTLLDAAHPERGTLAENGWSISSMKMNERGVMSAEAVRKDPATGETLGRATFANIGGISASENAAGKPMAGGMTGGRPTSVSGAEIQNLHTFSPNKDGSWTVSGGNITGMEGASSAVVKPTGEKDAKGRDLYDVTGYNAEGKVMAAKTLTAAPKASFDDVRQSLVGNGEGIAKTKEDRPMMFDNKRQMASIGQSMQMPYSSVSMPDASGKETPMQLDGASFGRPGEALGLKATDSMNGQMKMALTTADGHVVKEVSTGAEGFNAAKAQGPEAMREYATARMQPGQLSALDAKTLYDETPTPHAPTVSSGGAISYTDAKGEAQTAQFSRGGSASTIQRPDGSISMRQSNPSLNDAEAARQHASFNGGAVGDSPEYAATAIQTANGKTGSYTSFARPDGGHDVVLDQGGRSYLHHLDANAGIPPSEYAARAISNNCAVQEGGTFVSNAGGISGAYELRQEAAQAGTAMEAKIPEGCTAAKETVFATETKTEVHNEKNEGPSVSAEETPRSHRPHSDSGQSGDAPSKDSGRRDKGRSRDDDFDQDDERYREQQTDDENLTEHGQRKNSDKDKGKNKNKR